MTVIRVNALSAYDHNQSSTTRVVVAISHNGTTLSRKPYEGWFLYTTGEPHEEGMVVENDALSDRLGEILHTASADGPNRILELTLEGGRHFMIPRHHWPVFQISNA